MADVRTLDQVLGAAINQPRFLMFLMGAFAVFALGLAALGIYGVLSYAVAQRRQEIAIRMALGAQPGGVLWLVLRQGLLLTVAGSAAGVLAAWLAARALAAVLFGVAPGDPAALAGATGTRACRRGRRVPPAGVARVPVGSAGGAAIGCVNAPHG